MKKTKKYKCVVWDWNGTLLDDVDVNIKTINTLLSARGIAAIPSVDEYRRDFGFPIIEYYSRLGFDMVSEHFSDIADEYVTVYGENIKNAAIAYGAPETLAAVRDMGLRQVIVSAAEQSRLRREVVSYGIDGYFTDILGTGNNLGSSKADVARSFVLSCGASPDEILFVGDMEHDAEVAAACGCRAVLVSSGHQSAERLSRLGADVLPCVSDVLRLLE